MFHLTSIEIFGISFLSLKSEPAGLVQLAGRLSCVDGAGGFNSPMACGIVVGLIPTREWYSQYCGYIEWLGAWALVAPLYSLLSPMGIVWLKYIFIRIQFHVMYHHEVYSPSPTLWGIE